MSSHQDSESQSLEFEKILLDQAYYLHGYWATLLRKMFISLQFVKLFENFLKFQEFANLTKTLKFH